MNRKLWWAGLLSGGLFLQSALADIYRTPLAGEEYHTEVWGSRVTAPSQDRRHVTALNLGVQWIPDGPSNPLFLPFAHDQRSAADFGLLVVDFTPKEVPSWRMMWVNRAKGLWGVKRKTSLVRRLIKCSHTLRVKVGNVAFTN